MNGPIVTTSTTPEGALIIPQDVRKIGLWDKGAPIMGTDQQPQPEGTTLLAGHVNDVAQGNGTLHDLYQVEPGALVYVADPAGAANALDAIESVLEQVPAEERAQVAEVVLAASRTASWSGILPPPGEFEKYPGPSTHAQLERFLYL